MFELKYKVTERDIKAVNFGIALKYFVMYLVVALAGIGIGVAAIVTRPSAAILVMGIILAVLGVFLAVCSVLLMVAPKNFVLSAIAADDTLERNVGIDENGITISSEGSDIRFGYSEIVKVKNKNKYLLAYLNKAQVLLIKDAVVRGGTLAELYAFLRAETEHKGTPAASVAPVAADAAHTDKAEGEDANGDLAAPKNDAE